MQSKRDFQNISIWNIKNDHMLDFLINDFKSVLKSIGLRLLCQKKQLKLMSGLLKKDNY